MNRDLKKMYDQYIERYEEANPDWDGKSYGRSFSDELPLDLETYMDGWFAQRYNIEWGK